jgi:hypothetical protein
VWGLRFGMNKGGAPRVPSRAKMRIHRMPFFMDLAGVVCSRRLHRRTLVGDHAWRLLDQMGFGRAQPSFYLTVWFQRKRCEALLAVTIM